MAYYLLHDSSVYNCPVCRLRQLLLQVLDGDAKAIGRHNGMARKLQDTPVRSIGGRRFGHGGGTQQPLLPRRNVPAYATTGYNSDMISMAGPSG